LNLLDKITLSQSKVKCADLLKSFASQQMNDHSEKLLVHLVCILEMKIEGGVVCVKDHSKPFSYKRHMSLISLPTSKCGIIIKMMNTDKIIVLRILNDVRIIVLSHKYYFQSTKFITHVSAVNTS
jgi:hypothetical protein